MFTPSSWKMANTVTGSVALISEPKMRAWRKGRPVHRPTAPASHTINPTVTVDTAVPTKAKAQIPSKLLKKSRVCREKPLSKMMGGRSRKKNTSSLKSSQRVTLSVVFALHMTRPTPTPSRSDAPAS